MDGPDIECARRYVRERVPGAAAAFLGGSAGTSFATPTSDLDVVAVTGTGGAVLRRTDRYDGRLVEAFVHTPESLGAVIEQEVAVRRSPLLHMCAEGRLLLDRDGLGTRIQADARRRLAAGPPPLTPAEDEDRRYVVTDLLDDLAATTDPAELVFVAGRLVPLLAELVLVRDRRWIGSGKWLVRRLAVAAPGLADELVTSYRRCVAAADPAPLVTVGSAILQDRGGRLAEGYLRVAHTAAVPA